MMSASWRSTAACPSSRSPTPTTGSAGWSEHHDSAPGLWLKLAKKDAQIASVTYAQAVELALCFGWIDGQKGAYDERWWLQRFTPRGPRSRWSRINREKAQELERAGRLRPAGLARGRARAGRRALGGRLRGPARARPCPRICSASSTATPPRARSSSRSRATTATRSSTASTRPSGPRRARGGSRASWRCCAAGEQIHARASRRAACRYEARRGDGAATIDLPLGASS